MTQRVVERWMPTSLDELIEALDEIRRECSSHGHDLSTVYIDVRDLSLIETALTDGSKVMNLVVRENR